MENIEVFVRSKAAELAHRQYQNKFKQASAQDVMASLVAKFQSLPPEQQRLLLGAGGGAALGGASGAVGAIRNREANRSFLGDSIRGALAGGAVGGGGALAFNTATGGRTGLGGLADRIRPGISEAVSATGDTPDLRPVVDALDAARQNPDTVLNAISNAMWNNGGSITTTGAGIGGAMDLHNRFGTAPKARRFTDNLRQMVSNLGDGSKKEDLASLLSGLESNPSLTPKAMAAADRFSQNTGSIADRLTKARLNVSDRMGKARINVSNQFSDVKSSPTGQQAKKLRVGARPDLPVTPGQPDRAHKMLDRMLNPTSFKNSPSAVGGISSEDTLEELVRKVRESQQPAQPEAPVATRSQRRAGETYFQPGGKQTPPQPPRNRTFTDGSFTADDLRDASRGTGAAKAKPSAKGTVQYTGSVLSRVPGRRALLGAGAGAALSYGPGLLLPYVTGNNVSDQATGQTLRDFGIID